MNGEDSSELPGCRNEEMVASRAVGIWQAAHDRSGGIEPRGHERGWPPAVLSEARPDFAGRCARKPVLLVPVDLSPASFAAARFGVALAREARGVLLLVHAIHLNLSPLGPANPAWLKSGLAQEAVERVEPLLASAQQAGVTALFTVDEGSPAVVIDRVSRHWRPAAIILSRPRRNTLARWFWPGNTDRVMSQARCPVIFLQSGGN